MPYKLGKSGNTALVLSAIALLGLGRMMFAQSSVQVEEGSVSVTSGDRSRVVVTSTLSGVGTILAHDRTGRVEDVEVVFDKGRQTYYVKAGNEVHVEVDGRTGRYRILAGDRARVSGVVEHSLSGAGAVIRASQAGVSVELSGTQIDAMTESWRRAGMTEVEVEVQLRNLESLGASLDEAGRSLDEAGRSLDEVGRSLDALGRSIDRGTRRPGGTSSAPASVEGSGSASLSRTDAPIVCEGKRELRIEDRRVETDGFAVSIQGKCEVWIVNSEIVSLSDVAIVAAGKSTVHITGSKIEGRRASLDCSGSALVEASDTEFYGPVNTSANADFIDGGRNAFHR